MRALSLLRWSIIFSLFATPLVFLPQIYLSFELPKVLIFYLLSTLALIGLLLSKPRLGKLNLVHLLAILFVVWLVLASIIGVNFEHSFWGSYFRREGIVTWLGYLVLFVAAGELVKSVWFRKHAAWAVVISATAVGLLGLWQFTSLWFFGNSTQLLYSGRIISTFGQSNFLGAFLVMSLPFWWYLYLTSHKKITQRCLLAGAILVVLAVIFSFSRSAVLALSLFAFVWGIFHPKGFVVSLICLVCFVYIFGGFFPESMVTKQWNRVKVDLQQSWTAENRTLIAEKSAELLNMRPITGYGAENFILAFPTVLGPADLGLKDIVVDSAHNIFLDIGVESGIVGLGIFLIFSGFLFLIGFQKVRQSLAFSDEKVKNLVKEEKSFLYAQMLVVLVFLISHQFSVLSVVPLILFWFSAGVLAGPMLNVTHTHEQTLNRKILVTVLLLFFVSVSYFVIQNIRADTLFKRASGLELQNPKQAVELETKAASISPWVLFYGWRRDFLKKQLGE